VKVEANKPAVRTAWLVETNLLRDIAIALIAYGILTILGAFLAGPSRPATAIRRAAAPTLKEHPALVYAGAAVLFLIVIAWGPTAATRQLVGALILAALFFGGLEVWRRQAIREAAASEAAPGDPQKPALRGA
jgi:phosphate/sulfate permease